jgi:hypothetical protein
MERKPREPKSTEQAVGRPASAAEEAARKAPPQALSDEEKSALAAEVSRTEDA